MKKPGMINLKNTAYFFITAISLVWILMLGKDILLPFVFALLFWFAVRQIRLLMDRVPFLETKIPVFAKNILAIAILSFTAYSVINAIVSNINKLASSAEKYDANIKILVAKIYETFDINLWTHLQQYINSISLANLLMSLANISTDILGTVFMVFIYSIFIFWEESTFKKKLKKLFPDEKSHRRATSVINNIETATAKFFGIRTFISLLIGILSFLVLRFFEVDSPFFWASLIFLFNYIPVIGSIVATVSPAVFSLFQFGSLMPGILILALLTLIQVIIENILSTKLTGESMNLSPIVTVIALSFWGAVWGIPGMFLSVPITMFIVIIMNQFPSVRLFTIILSGKS